MKCSKDILVPAIFSLMLLLLAAILGLWSSSVTSISLLRRIGMPDVSSQSSGSCLTQPVRGCSNQVSAGFEPLDAV